MVRWIICKYLARIERYSDLQRDLKYQKIIEPAENL